MSANAIHQTPAQLAKSIHSQSPVKAPAANAAISHSDVKNSDPKNTKPAVQPSSVVNLGTNQKSKASDVYGPPAAVSSAAATGGFTVAKTGQVEVEIKSSESNYNNRIFWSTDNFKTRNYIGVDNQVGSVNLGSFKAGTKIDFGIENDQGQFFRTGGAAQNVDKVNHSRSTQTAQGLEIGFEDLAGGGDRDFNDAVISVRSVVSPLESAKTNRSGLADGTNPGQGAGRVNSPNLGSNNPGSRSDAVPSVQNATASVTNKSTDNAVKALPTQVYSSAVLQNNNRSGLADGSNPGKVSGNSKSINTGTLNPNTSNQPSNAPNQNVNLQLKAVSAVKAYTNVAQLVPNKPLNNPQQAVDKAKLDTPKPDTAKPEKSNATEFSAITHGVKAAIAAAINNSNRSGLGDGTNPGQGAGRANSPNLGVDNPNQVNAMFAKR